MVDFSDVPRMPATRSYPRVAMLGVGRMGQAVLAGMLDAGWDPSRIVAAEAHEPTANAVRERHGIEFRPSAQAVVGADVVVVAVKPHDVTGVLDDISANLQPGATVVSIAAGLPTMRLAAHLPRGHGAGACHAQHPGAGREGHVGDVPGARLPTRVAGAG